MAWRKSLHRLNLLLRVHVCTAAHTEFGSMLEILSPRLHSGPPESESVLQWAACQFYDTWSSEIFHWEAHIYPCASHTYKHWGWRLMLGVHPTLHLSMRAATDEQQRPGISASSGLRWQLHATTPRCCTWGLKLQAQVLMTEQQALFWLIHLYTPPWTHLASENFQVHPDLLAHIQK